MNDQTLVIVLVFLFAVIALLALGGHSFIRLVELILSNGSRVEALIVALHQALTRLSPEAGDSFLSALPDDMPITPEDPDSPSTGNTKEMK